MNPDTRSGQTSGAALQMRHVALLLAFTFMLTLAVVVGKKMSTEAMAVVIGIACGVAASIPTTALLFILLSRRDQQKGQEQRQGRPTAYPPVVVIQGGAPQALPMGTQAGYWPAPVPGPVTNRQFHLVGNDDVSVDV